MCGATHSTGTGAIARENAGSEHGTESREQAQGCGRDVPESLLPDGEGRRLQREDLGLHEELSHAPVDDLAVLRARVQDHHGALVVVLPILELCPGVLGL